MTQTMFPVIRLANGSIRYEIDTDKARLDLAVIHGFLARSHWATGIPLSVVERAIENSLVFGLYRDGRQIGFARIVSDHATFAYLADVFVLAPERGKRLGRWLVEPFAFMERSDQAVYDEPPAVAPRGRLLVGEPVSY